MAGKYQKAVDATLPKVQGADVVLVTDSHLYADKVQDYAFELGKKLGKPVGLEALGPWHQPYVDALADGYISKKEFLDAVKPDPASHDVGDIKGYIGQKRADAFYQKIADEVASGTKVYCLGTSHGTSDVLVDVRNSKLTDNLLGRIGTMDTNFVDILHQDSKNRIEKDPKAVFRDFCQVFEDGYHKLTEKQQIRYVELRMLEEGGQIKTKEDYRAAIKELYFAQHPEYEASLRDNKALQQAVSTTQMTGEFSKHIGQNRVRADSQIIAPKIADILEQQKSGLVVVYGTHHTEGHDDDIDGTLRQRGVSVAIVDPVLPPNRAVDIGIPAATRHKFMGEEAKIQEAAQRSGDPNRYTVRLDVGGIAEVKPGFQPSPVLNPSP